MKKFKVIKQPPPITAEQANMLLERYDRTEPALQRVLVATFAAKMVWYEDMILNLLDACHGGKGASPQAFASNLEFFAQLIEESGVHLGVPGMSKGVVPDTLRKYAQVLREVIARVEDGADVSV